MQSDVQLGLEHILFDRLKQLCYDYSETGNREVIEQSDAVAGDIN